MVPRASSHAVPAPNSASKTVKMASKQPKITPRTPQDS